MSSAASRRTAKRRVGSSSSSRADEKENLNHRRQEGEEDSKSMAYSTEQSTISSPKRMAKRRNIKPSSPAPVDRKKAHVALFHDVTQAMANMNFEQGASSSSKMTKKQQLNKKEEHEVEEEGDEVEVKFEEDETTEQKQLQKKKSIVNGDKATATKKKTKKRVGFVSSQPTEVLTYEKDEAPEINLASILNRSSSRTAALIPVSPIAQRRSAAPIRDDVIEEELAWDDDDGEDAGFFSLHDMQVEVKVTRDTEEMSISELRRELSERGKSTAGTKAELVRRLNRTLLRAKDVECIEDDRDE